MKALLFANTAWYLYNFRLALAQALRARGYEVVLVSPPGEHSARLEAHGFRWLPFPLSRKGVNPLRELLTIYRLWKLYRSEKPDVVHHFTIKCVLYGSLAARLAGVKGVINAVTGLGYVFISTNYKTLPLQWVTRVFYMLALQNSQVVFQNPDDKDGFIREGLVSIERTFLIRGSGVDINRFFPSPEPEDTPVVILPARLLWDKGVGDFVEAARLLLSKGIQARFVLVGDPDPENPSTVPLAVVEKWRQEGVIEWWRWQEDMPAVYAQANIVCFPSHREGLPKSLIEAAACGRAIVAADVPGSREVVRNGENGFLVPVSDVQELAAKLWLLLLDPSLRLTMGKNGRRLIEENFASDLIIDQTIAIYQQIQH
ncbi:MAG: glycosyltransferase family 4 protein [Anaerolineaceae bacterium]|nr:glycosyltransferase family 4 protein [Anaerolineaceae bacterium]